VPSIGKAARAVLGPRLFSYVSRYYLRFFGDYAKIAPPTFERIPAGAFIVDVGGGDGAPLNYLLAARPDVTVTMIDISGSVGTAVREEFRSRVDPRPATSIRRYIENGGSAPDAVIVLDVMHHVPPHDRRGFLADLHDLVRGSHPIPIVFKDVEPGSLSAKLNELADRYISNDKNVSPIGAELLSSLLREEFGADVRIEPTPLFQIEPPHYALVLTANGS
jgi:hypothetical protein